MPAARRGRACDTCHAIKLKCELGSTAGGEPPCERCSRLGKTCTVTPPMRQKDRIAELEAKLEEVTKLLRVQEIQDSSPNTSARSSPGIPKELKAEPKVAGSHSKKRRLESASIAEYLDDHETSSLDDRESKLEIDRVVSRPIQRQIFSKYRQEIEPVFPFPVAKTYEVLRDDHPLLLQAVVFAASSGVVSLGVQDELTSIVLKLLAPDEIAKCKKSVELVQAILIVSFWYRHHKNQTHVAINRLMNSAVTIAEDIGISEAENALSVISTHSGDPIRSSDAWRTWNLCYLLSSSLGSCMRMPSKILWNSELEIKLSSLEYGIDALSTDGLLCQFVRSEGLAQQIAIEAGYHSSDPVVLITDHQKIRRLQNLIIDRKAQTFSSQSYPSLKFYDHFAIILLNECILHTSTNKRSFAAPYIAERLSITDFPAPIVTPDHIAALYKLRDGCHSTLNTFLNFGIDVIASSPLIIFTAKAFYAIWLLIKLYVAVTATGNTYGVFMDAQSLELDNYLEKLAEFGDLLCATDAEDIAGRMLKTSRRLKEWVVNCSALQAEESFSSFSSDELTSVGADPFAVGDLNSIDWTAFDSNFLS